MLFNKAGPYHRTSSPLTGGNAVRVSLRWKIGSAFFLLTILALIMGVLTLRQMHRMESATVNIVFDAIPVTSAVRDLMTQLVQQETGMRGFVISGDEDLLEPYIFGKRAIRDNLDFIERHSGSYPSMRRLVDNARPLITELERFSDELIELARSGPEGMAEAQRRLPEGKVLMDQFTVLFANMLRDTNQVVLGAWEEVAAARQSTQTMILVAGIGIAGISLVIGLFVGGAISRPIARIAAAAGQVAEGNLDQKALAIPSRDEVGDMTRAFNHMVSHLRHLVQNVSEATRAVLDSLKDMSDISREVAAGAQRATEAIEQVASGTGDQARATEQVRDIMGQLRQAVQEIAAGSQQTADQVHDAMGLLGRMAEAIEQVVHDTQRVAEDAQEAARAAEQGAAIVSETTAGMGRIRQSVLHAASLMQELESLSSRIGDITRVIADIADQTNLLALNAAIEAARAGHHGAGFAVVADEVRKLAERSAASSGQIRDLIATIQERTTQAAAAMEAGSNEAEAGSALAQQTGEALQRILQTVERAARQMQAIAASAREVYGGTEHVVRAFDAVAALTNESTAATEEVAAGSADVMDAVSRVAGRAQANAEAAEQLRTATQQWTASAHRIAAHTDDLSRVARNLEEQIERFTVREQ